MEGGTFITVGKDKEFCLKDMEVQCYGNYEPTWNVNRWRGQCKAPNGFAMMTLDDEGYEDETFYWQYWKEGDHDNPTVTRGWFKSNGEGGYVALSAEELAKAFPAGQGFYIMGNGNALRPAGQVAGDAEVDSISKGFCVIANATPCDMTLGKVSVTCHGNYEPTWNVNRWRGQCKAPNGFVMMTLDDEGYEDQTYYWQYWKEGDHDSPTVTQGWFKSDGAGGYVKMEKDELDAVEVKAGQAFYVMGNGNTLNFPGPEL